MKVVVILGTRAELIKVFPLIKRIQESEHELVFVHTGQHKIQGLCNTFDIPAPDKVLSEVPEDSSKFKGSLSKAVRWNLTLIKDIRNEISTESPDYVAYHGDTMSTALAALGSSRLLFPFRSFRTVHIEAGLRSESIREPFPEEISRIFSDAASNLLFAVSSLTEHNLRFHKLAGKSVYSLGNTVVDSAREAEKIGERYERENYGIVTIHRHENLGSEERMEKIVRILEESPRDLIFPLHDNTRSALQEYGLLERIQENDEIQVMDLIDYPDFINMVKGADILYTDGGSIQEESLIYQIPCIVLRNRTERKEGIDKGINYLSGFNVERTSEKAAELVEKDFDNFPNPYGRPGVTKKIIEKLEDELK